MLDLSNAVHAQYLPAMMMFASGGNPLGGPPEGLAFFRINYIIYSGPAFDIIYDPT
jgi:hypothetical protein